jgi:hypothetical protein
MAMMKLVTVVCAGLMAASAMAETNTADPTTPANTATTTTAKKKKKKIIQKKSLSRQGAVTTKSATEDHHTLPQATPLSPSTATTSMPAVTAGTTTAEAPKAMKKKTFADKLRAGVQFEYYGSGLTDPFNGDQPDHSTGYGQGAFSAELDTRVTAGIAFSDNLTLSYNAYFWSYSDSGPGENDGQRFGFRPADSYLKLGVGKFVQAGRFKWSGDFRVYPGLGHSADRLVVYLRTGQNLSYSITPRLTLAAYNSLRYYVRTASAYNREDRDPTGNQFDSRFTFGPAIEYQLFDHAGVSLSFNTEIAHSHNNNSFDSTPNYHSEPVASLYRAYFELGGMIDITKGIYFNPYVDGYTQSFNADAMQIGANLAITFL